MPSFQVLHAVISSPAWDQFKSCMPSFRLIAQLLFKKVIDELSSFSTTQEDFDMAKVGPTYVYTSIFALLSSIDA